MEGKQYKTIYEKAEASFEERKSEFIGYLCPCETEQQALDFLEEIRQKHRKATHNCYAYLLRENNIARYSDDGEPSGTAGMPILEVLKKEGVTDICCVVTRYYGGILLGAGGLVRAYGKAVSLALEQAKPRIVTYAAKLELSLSYSLYGRIPGILASFGAITEREIFEEDVKVTVFVPIQNHQALKDALIDRCHGQIVIKDMQNSWADFS